MKMVIQSTLSYLSDLKYTISYKKNSELDKYEKFQKEKLSLSKKCSIYKLNFKNTNIISKQTSEKKISEMKYSYYQNSVIIILYNY